MAGLRDRANKIIAWFTKLRRVHLWLLLVLVLIANRIPYFGKILLDDAFITFRYARNFVDHGQFVFNLGENVLATTTPLYAGLLSGLYWLHLPVAEAAAWLNLVVESGLLLILIALLQLVLAELHLPDGQPIGSGLANLACILCGGLLITNQSMSFSSAGGMETALFVMLNVATLYCVLGQRYLAGAVMGSLASLTRPDGIFALVVLGIAILIRQRRLPMREVLVSLLIALPWLVVAYKTYGSFIPQSVAAKDAIAHIWPITFTAKLQTLFFRPLRAFGLVAWPLIAWAVFRLLRAAPLRVAFPILLFTALHFAYVFLPNNLGFDWYYVPLYAMLDVLTALGLVFLLSPALKLPEGGLARWRRGTGWLCALALFAAMPYTAVGNYLLAATQDQIWRQGMLAALNYLHANVPADQTIQSDSIGILGYFSEYNILDSMGLASPQVMPLIRAAASDDALMVAVANTFQPPWIVTSLPEPYPNYQMVARFETPYVPFFIYQRSK